MIAAWLQPAAATFAAFPGRSGWGIKKGVNEGGHLWMDVKSTGLDAYGTWRNGFSTLA